MKRSIFILVLILLFTAYGCGGKGRSPLTPGPPSSDGAIAPLAERQAADSGSSRVLWGFYEVSIDGSTLEVEIVPSRRSMFTANVTHFLSPPVSPRHCLAIEILPGSDIPNRYLDINVTLVHPFQGLNQYKGFDVRGIFMADGSHVSEHDPAIRYGTAERNEAYMLNPDGYARWWNATEFTDPMPVLSFVNGALASDPNPTATLNPYKYFADDLPYDANVADLPVDSRGVFSPTANGRTREYQIQFPKGTGPSFQFNYAVAASWEEPDPEWAPDYPINSFPPEAQCQEAYHVVVDTSDSTAWYKDGESGGEIRLSIEVFDWQAIANPDGLPGEIAAIWVESSLMNHPVDILPLATYTDGSQPTSGVFQVNIASDMLNLTASGDFPLLLSVESADPSSYQPQIPGGDSFIFPDGPLAAYTIASVTVDEGVQPLILVQPNGGEIWAVGSSEDITWTGGSEVDSVVLEYSKDDFVADVHMIVPSTDNDGVFEWTPIPDDPSETVKVRVIATDDPANSDDSDDYFAITDHCIFDQAPTYESHVDTGSIFSTGYHYMQIDTDRLVGCRPEADGDPAFPWLAVYDESDLSTPLDTFQVPGYGHPDRPWCFEVDSNDRIFFFMCADYPSPDGSTFDTVYYISWDGSQIVDSSFGSFDVSGLLDPGELGAKIWVDSFDDVYALTTEGKMLAFDHSNGYTGTELFDLDGNPDYPDSLELDFVLVEDEDVFFIYTAYGAGLRAIYRVSSTGTIENCETDIFSGLLTKCGSITGGIGADGDCRLVVIDGHLHYGWGCIRYDYDLAQKATSITHVLDMQAHPGNTMHFADDGTILFNTDAWVNQTLIVTFSTPSDW